MHAQADRFAQAPIQLARAGADTLVEALERALVRDTHGDRRLSNLDGAAPPPRVTTREDSAEVTAGGAVWAILENGTRAHTIRPRRGKALHIGDEWRAGPARVRGVRGRHTYTRAVEQATQAVFDAQRVEWERLHDGR